MKFKKVAIRHLLRGFAIVAVAIACSLFTASGWGFDTVSFDFSDPAQFTDNFYNYNNRFSHSGGIGSDPADAAGRVSLTGNTTAKAVAIYDTTPDEYWGPDNGFSDVKISVDFKFNTDTLSSEQDPAKQFFAVMFNIDGNREDTGERDCLLFQIRNVDHVGDPSDTWTFRRGKAISPDYGSTFYEEDFTNPVPLRDSNIGNNWLRLVIELQNNEDDTMLDFKATLYDLLPDSTTPIIETVELNDLVYADLGALPYGEIGIMASNQSPSKNSVKWDNFMIEDLIPDYTPGDANKDGKVDGSDVTILANNWQKGVPGGDSSVIWEMGDFNGDHMVDGSDVTLLASYWQHGVTTPAATVVPEPTTLILLLGVLASLAVIRRVKK